MQWPSCVLTGCWINLSLGDLCQSFFNALNNAFFCQFRANFRYLAFILREVPFPDHRSPNIIVDVSFRLE